MKIVFNLICKNEESIILKCLESIEPLVDSFCVLDTGSTDSTIDKIKEFRKTTNKPFKLIQKDFVDFSTMRNLCMDESKELGDVVFWQDCDEFTELNSIELLKIKESVLELIIQGCNGISTNINSGNCLYKRINFIKINQGVWCGKIHEYLEIDKLVHYNVEITKITCDGNSHKNPNKYLQYGDILLEEYTVNKNPRDLFYAANSYRDYYRLSKNKQSGIKAIALYLERSKLDGYIDEKYCSLLYAGRLHKEIINDSTFLEILMVCEEIPLNRIEHLYEIASYYYSQGFNKTALMFTKMAFNKSKLSKREIGLFMETDIYFNKLIELHKKIM